MNLYLCETKEINAALDKWLSRLPFTEKITGSTPVRGTLNIFIKWKN